MINKKNKTALFYAHKNKDDKSPQALEKYNYKDENKQDKSPHTDLTFKTNTILTKREITIPLLIASIVMIIFKVVKEILSLNKQKIPIYFEILKNQFFQGLQRSKPINNNREQYKQCQIDNVVYESHYRTYQLIGTEIIHNVILIK